MNILSGAIILYGIFWFWLMIDFADARKVNIWGKRK